MPICRFSSIDSEGNTLFVCGTKPTPARTRRFGFQPVMSAPFSETLPPRIDTWPNTAFKNVDLPAPLGPMMPMSSPGRASMLTPLRILIPGR